MCAYHLPFCYPFSYLNVLGNCCLIYIVQINAARDTTGMFKKMRETMPKLPTPEEAAAAVLNVVDSSTREKHGGLFYYHTGAVIDW